MIDFLAGPLRRRILFTALYVSEGAPIGFLWLALPTRLKAADVPLTEITALTAALVIPWTFKFAWAPLVDVLRTPKWTLKHWILSAQVMMGLTLLPLLWADPLTSMTWLGAVLLVHATCAATQDVAIDALCISVTDAGERGRLNGWMQAGMLGGRAAMGGGALMLSAWLGDTAVVVLLISITTFSGFLLLSSTLPAKNEEPGESRAALGSTVTKRLGQVGRELQHALRGRTVWIGFLFALIGPACFKAFEVIIGPFLIDRAWTVFEVGRFTAIVMIGMMVLGSLVGGVLADRFSRRGFLAGAMMLIVSSLTALALTDIGMEHKSGVHLPVLIAATSFGIGIFTVAMYAMFMDLTSPTLAATQFSAYMGATNGCESWSTYAIGILIVSYGYPVGILTLCAISILALPLLFLLPGTREQEGP